MENKESLSEKSIGAHRSNESVFGTLLLATLIIFTVASIIGVGFVAYTKWHTNKQESSQPSIAMLTAEQGGDKEKTSDRGANSEAANKQKETENKAADSSRNETIAKLKGTAISVLNGGAAKGSAAVVTDLLKKEGYAKAVSTNATSDYTGVVVYYASGLEQSADIIKEVLVKKYPNTVIKAALSGNKETAVSPITVILGK